MNYLQHRTGPAPPAQLLCGVIQAGLGIRRDPGGPLPSREAPLEGHARQPQPAADSRTTRRLPMTRVRAATSIPFRPIVVPAHAAACHVWAATPGTNVAATIPVRRDVPAHIARIGGSHALRRGPVGPDGIRGRPLRRVPQRLLQLGGELRFLRGILVAAGLLQARARTSDRTSFGNTFA